MKKSLLFSVVTFLSIHVTSQITITSANMPVSGDTCRYSNASLTSVGDYTATGVNYTWDFSTLDSTSQGIRKFEAAGSTPYTFFGTGYGEKIADSIGFPPYSFKNIYNFYKKTTASFYVDGLGITYSGFPIPNFYQDKDELYLFPLNYFDRDSTYFKFKSLSTGTTIPTYSKEGYRITEADGWGTITTPYGTQPCLRVVTTQYSQDTVKGTAFGFPFKIGFPNYQRSYQWLTLTERIPYLEVSGTVAGGNFNPTRARYRDIIRSFVGLKEEANVLLALSVFPNPSTHELTLIIPKNGGSIKSEIIDVQGKVVLSKELINNSEIVNQHQLDVSSLAKGLYILNLSTVSGKQTLKISIQ